ncbi:hypothetical protein AURDEDRAFT_172159 [Auricularia subglabra TFB-10046 SS5]|nr:hypothetical protein AURDEDRAFT_172159 [Auricularia subglabra TFB-10046 SS5]
MDGSATLMEQLQPLIASLERGRVVHYVHLAAACAFAYDHLTTFSAEVSLIWHAQWGAGKVLFLIVRYITWPELFLVTYIEMFNIRPRVCNVIFSYSAWSIMIGVTFAEMVLILRTWAIWGGRRAVLVVLSALLFCMTISNSYLIGSFLSGAQCRASAHIKGVQGCVLVSASNRIGIAWISITVFELGVVIMTLIKGIEHFKHGSSNLLSSLYRDGILYFIFLFAMSLANVVFLYTSPQEYLVLLGEMQRAFHAILACRIILHLRSATATAVHTSSMGAHGRLPAAHSTSVWFGNVKAGETSTSDTELWSVMKP